MRERPATRFLLTSMLLLGLASPLMAQPPEPVQPSVPDHEVGLSRQSVFETPSPEPVIGGGGDPGDNPLLPRAYPGAPPRIPHGIADLLPITRGENLCLDCHQTEERVEGGPTPVPASHFTDLRRAPDEVREQVAGARWVCVTCHVPRTDARALVGNRFGTGEPAEAPTPGPYEGSGSPSADRRSP